MTAYYEYRGATETWNIFLRGLHNPTQEWVKALRCGAHRYDGMVTYFAEGIEFVRNNRHGKYEKGWASLRDLIQDTAAAWRPKDWEHGLVTPAHLDTFAPRVCLIVRLLAAGFCIRLSRAAFRKAIIYENESAYKYTPDLIQIIGDDQLWSLIQLNHTAAAPRAFASNRRINQISTGIVYD